MEIKKSITLDGNESLSKALSSLEEAPAVLVTKNGIYHGMIDHRSINNGIKEPHNTRCENAVINPPLIVKEAGVGERISYFLKGHFKALPVVDDREKPLGITTRVELLKELLENKDLPRTRVSDMMSTPLYSIEEDKTIADLKKEIRDKNTSKLVVTRKNKPIGIVSTFDVGAWGGKHNIAGGRRDLYQSKPIDFDGMKISGFLRTEMTTISEKSTIEEAARKMTEKEVSSIIAMSGDKAVGVLSALDIFKYLQGVMEQGSEIHVSGLDEEDMHQYQSIKDKIGSVLDKFSKSFNIRNGKLHVKKGKNVYTVSIYFDTDDGHVSLKGERATLKETVDELSEELDTVLKKKKEMRRIKPRATHYKGR